MVAVASMGLGLLYNSIFLESSYAIEMGFFTLVFVGSYLLIRRDLLQPGGLLFFTNIAAIVAYMTILQGFNGMHYLYYFPVVMSALVLYDGSEQVKELIIIMTVFATALVIIVVMALLGYTTHSGYDLQDQFRLSIFHALSSMGLFVATIIILLRANRQRVLELRSATKDRDLLLAEMNHRVKNNMAVVSGIMSLHANMAKSETERENYLEARSRIQSMAQVHTMLYQSESFENLKLDELISDLARQIQHIYDKEGKVQFEMITAPYEVGISIAVPVGLVLNEVLSNCFKHGVANRPNGVINCRVERKTSGLTIRVKDNGNGVADPDNMSSESSLGMTIIHSLVDQIDAKFRFYNEDGLVFEMYLT